MMAKINEKTTQSKLQKLQGLVSLGTKIKRTTTIDSTEYLRILGGLSEEVQSLSQRMDTMTVKLYPERPFWMLFPSRK